MVVYRCEQVISRGRNDGARRVAVAVRVLPYIPPPCERDLIGALTHERPYRPTTAYGRYHHLRDVAWQPVNAPRPLNSCIVMRWGEGAWGVSRYPDLLRIRLYLRLPLRHPVAEARLGKDAGRVLRVLPPCACPPTSCAGPSGSVPWTRARSEGFDRRRAKNVPHCDSIVSFTSEGRWLTTMAPTPYFLPSLTIL